MYKLLKIEKYEVNFLGLAYQTGTQWFKATCKIGGFTKVKCLSQGCACPLLKHWNCMGDLYPF